MVQRHHIYSAAMILLLIFVAWTVMTFQAQHNSHPHSDLLPDTIIDDVTALIMDKQGKPSMKIIAPKLQHYTDNNAAHLQNPYVTIYRKSTQPWYVSAKRGLTTQGLDHIKFWDDVTIQHAADTNAPTTLIKTATLTVHPDSQTAETADPITLIQPNITVNATGMHADINTGDVKLLSAARGVYAPAK